MLTAKSEDMDKILGLEYGADDYITKPFNILEVKARIKAIMRRTARKEESAQTAKILVKGNMRIDCESRRVFIGEREINLTAKEYDVLELLAMNPNKVYSVRICWILYGVWIIRGMPEQWMYISEGFGRRSS